MDLDIVNTFKGGVHPLHQFDFDNVLSNLDERVDSGLLNRQQKPGFNLYNYSIQCQFEKKWDIYTLAARGLVLDMTEKKKIYTFCKFFNYGEMSLALPECSFTSWQKVDGSFICVWWNAYTDEWDTSTRGSFQSDQAIAAKKWLYSNCDLNLFNKDYSYLCEWIGPDNQVVIKYEKNELVLLGAYDLKTGVEIF